MKHLLIVVFTLAFFVQNCFAQNSKLYGSWLLTRVDAGGQVQKPYQVSEFTSDGKMLMMGMEVASWKYNKSTNSIEMESDFDKDFNGIAKIVKLDKDELIFDKDDVKVFYQKLNETKITSNNKNSGLFGTWEFKDVPYSEATTLITFTEPDQFKIIHKEEGYSSNSDGTFIFNKQNSSLIMAGLRCEDTFHGENRVVKISGEKLALEHNETTFKGIKKVQKDTKIEHLTFAEDDFYTEGGDYKYYDDEEKLPWRNWSEMKSGLLNVKQLVYNYSTLVEGSESFETKTLTADVRATPDEEGFAIDNIFVGYDRYNLPDDVEFHVSNEYSNPLYPLEDDVFRVVGKEQITTPAGTFDCTVLEGINDSGTLKKLWMVTDKIGVYAKIIDDNPDEFWGYYSVYELQEIR
ncbi:hypothetical protein [uncultured Draconibacterium sp.]|uniref:hypothetical protein n=1 Tax=uncultured Draconibacterium sp. TaxID=1573823 RepID=UPI0032611564